MAFKLGVQYDKPLALTVSHNSAKDQGNLLITETFAILAKMIHHLEMLACIMFLSKSKATIDLKPFET